LGCVEQDEKIEAYFEELRNKANEDGILVVAKETSGDDTTLWNLYNSFGKKGGAKDLLVKAFSSDSINGDLKENGISGYCWRTHSLKKIIFMVDNTLSGSSLKKMLDFHINGVHPIKKLYNIDNKITGSFIFRYSNMPAKYAFPKDVVESLNLVGLFQRRDEI